MLEAAIGHHAWRLRDITEPTLEQLRSLEAADLVAPDEEEEEPVVAEDGTLLPPADAPPAVPVDALSPADAPEPTVEVDKGRSTRTDEEETP